MSNTVTKAWRCGLIIACVTCAVSQLPVAIMPCLAQAQPELKAINPDVITEPGCPVAVTSAKTDMEIDPFGTPVAARHYIDYRNIGNKPVAAVKFRIGYVGADGKIQLPYLNAPDGHVLDPGAAASQKWRGDRVPSTIAAIKIRVLMVKYADGSVWQSEKVNQTSSAPDPLGFMPLTAEGSDSYSPARAPGTPVQFKDYGAHQFQGLPDKSVTGAVPFSSTQPASGFAGVASRPPVASPASASVEPAASYTAPSKPDATSPDQTPGFAPQLTSSPSAAPSFAPGFAPAKSDLPAQTQNTLPKPVTIPANANPLETFDALVGGPPAVKP